MIYRKKQCKITNLSTSGTFMTLPGTMRSTSGLASPRMSMCANSWMMWNMIWTQTRSPSWSESSFIVMIRTRQCTGLMEAKWMKVTPTGLHPMGSSSQCEHHHRRRHHHHHHHHRHLHRHHPHGQLRYHHYPPPRWMNGSGRGALLFESEGRWSTKVSFLGIMLLLLLLLLLSMILEKLRLRRWSNNPGAEQWPWLCVWGSSWNILRVWDAGSFLSSNCLF